MLPVIMLLTVAVVFAACMGFSGYSHYDRQLDNEAELLKLTAEQVAAGLDMQFTKLEDVSVTLLANQDYMKFDPADHTNNTEYEISQKLAELKKTVTSLSLMDNYCDFALIYKSDAAAGKLSDGTREALSNDDGKVYPVLDEMLGDQRRMWLTGYNDRNGKIYYVSRASDHSLFIGGFYTEELKYMTPLNGREDMQMLLINEKGSLVLDLSSEEKEADFDFISADSYALVSDTNVQAGKKLNNGWTVVLTSDMTDTYELYKKLALETAIAMILTLAVLIILFYINYKGDGAFGPSPVISPEVDMLTGITNAEEAENTAADRLETCVSGSTYMLAIVRIINLSELEKKYGRAGYNGAIIKAYRAIAEFLGTDDPDTDNIIGRMSEGEFLIVANFTQYDLFKANDELKEGLIQLSEALNSVYIHAPGDVHICTGAAVYPHSSTDYDELYSMAEKALAEAINDDERCYAIFRKEKGPHKW